MVIYFCYLNLSNVLNSIHVFYNSTLNVCVHCYVLPVYYKRMLYVRGRDGILTVPVSKICCLTENPNLRSFYSDCAKEHTGSNEHYLLVSSVRIYKLWTCRLRTHERI